MYTLATTHHTGTTTTPPNGRHRHPDSPNEKAMTTAGPETCLGPWCVFFFITLLIYINT